MPRILSTSHRNGTKEKKEIWKSQGFSDRIILERPKMGKSRQPDWNLPLPFLVSPLRIFFIYLLSPRMGFGRRKKFLWESWMRPWRSLTDSTAQLLSCSTGRAVKKAKNSWQRNPGIRAGKAAIPPPENPKKWNCSLRCRFFPVASRII